MLNQPFSDFLAVIASPSTGKPILIGRTLHTFKLVSANTGGQFALMEAIMQPHVLVPPHTHTREDELAIALEGELGVRIGDQEFHVGPGSYVYIPRGTPHALWNRSDIPGKGISMYSPAGLENYFEEMGEVFAASNPPDYAKLGPIHHKYGIINSMEWVPELSAKYGLHMG